jgi:two-component system response regulator RegA
VRTAADATQALALASLGALEFALVDVRMPGAIELDIVQQLHRLDPDTQIVIFSSAGYVAIALEAVRSGAARYLGKPADVDQIITAFETHHAAAFAGPLR